MVWKTNHLKLSAIRSLMLIAQLLLMALVANWLIMQYHEQERFLLNRIENAWSAAQQQMIDSLLMKDFINPAMDSSKKVDRHNTDKSGMRQTIIKLDKDSLVDFTRSSSSHQNGQRKIIVKLTDSTRFRSDNLRKTGTKDIVLQGVKLFVNEFSDSAGLTNKVTAWVLQSDTNLMKSTFTRKISEIDPSIHIKWNSQNNSDSTTRKNHDKGLLVMNSGNRQLLANVSGYKILILGKLLPQIAFALFLVLLTALAFIISLRSLRIQARLNIQRNDFIRNMSHELKTPVSTVKVALEALKKYSRKNEPAVMDEYLDMATAETGRLELLISRVMTISENGEALLPDLKKVDIIALIKEVVAALKPRMDMVGATINLLFTDEECLVSLDRLHIQGVLINLIDNSLKYSAKPVHIEIQQSSTLSSVNIKITDNGTSIPEEFREKIFEKFFRVPAGDLHNVKGYGLGLSYAYTVMKQHRGSIRYMPGLTGGNVFELQFHRGE